MHPFIYIVVVGATEVTAGRELRTDRAKSCYAQLYWCGTCPGYCATHAGVAARRSSGEESLVGEGAATPSLAGGSLGIKSL